MTPPIRAALGVRLPNSGPFAEPDAILETATLVEALGYDRVWVHDHISWAKDKLTHFATGSIEACRDQDPNFFESVTTSALLLGRLRRVNVGIAGLVLPLRDPRVLGKQLTTIERLGGSRLVVAFGIGAIRGDFEVMGVPFERRGRLTTDYLGALRAMAGAQQPVSYESDSITFADGTFLPRPGSLPLWVTGSSDAGLKRAVALADGWMTVYHSVSEYEAALGRLRSFAEEAGRDPASLDTGYETYVTIGATHEAAVDIARRSLEEKFKTLEHGLDMCVVGSVDEVAERLAAYADAGARHLELKFVAHELSQVHEMAAQLAEVLDLARAVSERV